MYSSAKRLVEAMLETISIPGYDEDGDMGEFNSPKRTARVKFELDLEDMDDNDDYRDHEAVETTIKMFLDLWNLKLVKVEKIADEPRREQSQFGSYFSVLDTVIIVSGTEEDIKYNFEDGAEFLT